MEKKCYKSISDIRNAVVHAAEATDTAADTGDHNVWEDNTGTGSKRDINKLATPIIFIINSNACSTSYSRAAS